MEDPHIRFADPDQKLVRRSGVEERPLKDGALLVDMNTGRCFKLDRVGAEIWTLLNSPLSVHDICQTIGGRYHRSATEIEPEIRSLTSDLVREGLATSAPQFDR